MQTFRPPVSKQEAVPTPIEQTDIYPEVVEGLLEFRQELQALKELTNEIKMKYGDTEGYLTPQIKALDDQMLRMGDLIIAYKSKENTSRKYKPMFEKAGRALLAFMSRVNEATRLSVQRETGFTNLEDLKEEYTTRKPPSEGLVFKDDGIVAQVGSVLSNLVSFVTDTADKMERVIEDIGTAKRKRVDQQVGKRLAMRRRKTQKYRVPGRAVRAIDKRLGTIMAKRGGSTEVMKGDAQQLAEIEGYADIYEMIEAVGFDSVMPGICTNDGCDYTTRVEPDSATGWCEVCETNTVASPLRLMGLI